MRQVTTLALIEDGDKVLLAMKKRGFGEGWWNGYGGKVAEGETIEKAMVRELEEESGLVAKTWRERGVIDFYFAGTDKIVEMHIFEVTEYEGVPVETEEMRPMWFTKEKAPYNEMWPADREWMPLFFDGKDFTGTATFDSETKAFIEADFKVIEKDIK
jgi:8-oxo-dGTP pyrophosphatase MutT (NUDIX family)